MSDTQVIGLSEAIVHIQQWGEDARMRIAGAVVSEAFRIEAVLKDDVLAGGIVKLRTKRLRDSVHTEIDDQGNAVTATIGTDVEYAKYLESGTAAHEIRAVNAKALAFMIGGSMIFRKKVMHPGIPALRPFGGTLDRERDTIIANITAAAESPAS